MFTVIITGNSTKTLSTKTFPCFESVENYVERVLEANSSWRCFWYKLEDKSFQIDVWTEDEKVNLVN